METQKTIMAWGQATFGEHTALATATRMNVELAELISVLGEPVPNKRAALEESADVTVVLYQVADRAGYDLRECIERVRSAHAISPLAWAIVAQMAATGLIYNLANDRPQDCADYLGQIGFAMEKVAAGLGDFLGVWVDNKMAINRNRSWSKTEGGRFQHT